MLKNILALRERRIEDVMVPRATSSRSSRTSRSASW
jgi:CBS domain containing-hemolysin-like protein